MHHVVPKTYHAKFHPFLGTVACSPTCLSVAFYHFRLFPLSFTTYSQLYGVVTNTRCMEFRNCVFHFAQRNRLYIGVAYLFSTSSRRLPLVVAVDIYFRVKFENIFYFYYFLNRFLICCFFLF